VNKFEEETDLRTSLKGAQECLRLLFLFVPGATPDKLKITDECKNQDTRSDMFIVPRLWISGLL